MTSIYSLIDVQLLLYLSLHACQLSQYIWVAAGLEKNHVKNVFEDYFLDVSKISLFTSSVPNLMSQLCLKMDVFKH